MKHMDIQAIITEALEKLNANQDLVKEFMANPVKTLEEKLGIDLPDDQINAVIDGIKAKLNLDDAATEAKGLWSKIKSLFSGKQNK